MGKKRSRRRCRTRGVDCSRRRYRNRHAVVVAGVRARRRCDDVYVADDARTSGNRRSGYACGGLGDRRTRAETAARQTDTRCHPLAVFIPQHIALWHTFPLWYHLTFLLSLVPLTYLGGANLEQIRSASVVEVGWVLPQRARAASSAISSWHSVRRSRSGTRAREANVARLSLAPTTLPITRPTTALSFSNWTVTAGSSRLSRRAFSASSTEGAAHPHQPTSPTDRAVFGLTFWAITCCIWRTSVHSCSLPNVSKRNIDLPSCWVGALRTAASRRSHTRLTPRRSFESRSTSFCRLPRRDA